MKIMGMQMPIVGNNKAQPDLFISREWLSKTLLSIEEAVIVTEESGNITLMNKGAEILTGRSFSEAKGKPIEFTFDVIDQYTHHSIENPLRKALKENKVTLLANHTILIKKNKTRLVISHSAIPIHNANWDVVGAVLFFRDITEQSNSHQKLIASEGLLKSIIDHTRSCISVKDLKGRYLMLNKQQEQTLNAKAGELIGKASPKNSFKEGREISRRRADVIKYKNEIEFEETITNANGVSHSYQTSMFPLFGSGNKVSAVCTVSTDISESKKHIEMRDKIASLDSLLQSEVRYEELIDNMPNLFFAFDRDLRFITLNKATERFIGKTAAAVIGKTVEEAYPPNQHLPDFKEVLKTGIAKNSVSSVTHNKIEYTYILNIFPTERGISILMTDLTVQKKAEKETHELVNRLQQMNKDLRQFAYIVSHNLRSPIAKVLGLVTLLETDPGMEINNMSLQECLVVEANNLDSVVKDLNSVISAHDPVNGKREYHTFESNLQLIKQMLDKEIHESNAAITTDFESAPGITSINGYVYSIMYNLISNAIKYRSPSVPLKIHLQTKQDDDLITFSISDNGMGINMKKYKDKIFGLYKRFHGTKIMGKGIGLSLVKSQAEALGGAVTVESQVNIGTTFKVSIPKNNTHDETS